MTDGADGCPGGLVYLLWPVAMGYLRIATHSAVFDHRSPWPMPRPS